MTLLGAAGLALSTRAAAPDLSRLATEFLSSSRCSIRAARVVPNRTCGIFPRIFSSSAMAFRVSSSSSSRNVPENWTIPLSFLRKRSGALLAKSEIFSSDNQIRRGTSKSMSISLARLISVRTTPSDSDINVSRLLIMMPSGLFPATILIL